MKKAKRDRTDVRGGQQLPADTAVDFVLHAPGRDYDVVAADEFRDDAPEVDAADDIDEDAQTDVWQPPTSPASPGHNGRPWWVAARAGVRARASIGELKRSELAWWEAARLGLRASSDD